MKIFASGNLRRIQELKEKIGSNHSLDTEEDHHPVDHLNYDLYFHLNLDDNPSQLNTNSYPAKKIVLACAVKFSLAQFRHEREVPFTLIGINGLSTFINRPKTEISLMRERDEEKLNVIMNELGWQYGIVKDRVGMVTPRVITMIINEACFTLQEGTATKEDIDKAMKLGTNYPYGPFEWCDKIGIQDVYETLEAIWNDTHDERYKICPLLKTMYLKNESFY